jgi:hypothetical protein
VDLGDREIEGVQICPGGEPKMSATFEQGGDPERTIAVGNVLPRAVQIVGRLQPPVSFPLQKHLTVQEPDAYGCLSEELIREVQVR